VTQPLYLLLMTAAVATPPTVYAGESSSNPSEPLQGSVDMGPTDQRQWARELLARLDRVDRILPVSEDSQYERSEYVELIDRKLRQGAISQSELAKLADITDQREKDAIERLARQFRVQVYKTFRQRRGVFTRRRMAWNRVLASWEEAGGAFEQQDRLIDWLELALQRSMPKTAGPLPSEPAFHLPKRDVATVSHQEMVPSEPTIAPIEPVIVQDESSIPIPLEPVVNLPERNRRVAEPEPLAEIPPAVPKQPPGVVEPLAVQPSLVPPSPVPPATVPPAESPALPTPVEDAPFVERLLHQVAKPALDPTPPVAAGVKVNLEELTAHIAGANLELRALEAELDKQSTFNAKRLGPLVDRLSRLVVRENDLTLLLNLVSERERTLAGHLESPWVTISRLAAGIFEARTRAAGRGFQGTENQRQAELRHLDELSRELAGLAAAR